MTGQLTDPQRRELAAWYWKEIDESWSAHVAEHPDDPTGGERTQDLISAAICEGLTGLHVDVGDGVSVPLHELVAPFRVRPGGLAESSEADRRRVLDRPLARRFRRWEW